MRAHRGSSLARWTALAAGLGGAAAPLSAHADWQCTDAFGIVYRFELLPLAGDISCTLPDKASPGEPARASAIATALVPAPLEPMSLAAASTPGAPRHGGLVLAPALRGPADMPAAAQPTVFDPLIQSIAQSLNQDADLLRAIVQVESHFDPGAVSAKGAVGLMQVMPTTAAELGLVQPRLALFEPASNLRIGALHLRRLLDAFPGHPELAIAAYNAGEWAVVRSGFAVPPYPETRSYVQSVLAIWADLRARR